MTLPRDWVEVPLDAAGQWVGGGTPAKREPRFWAGGTVPWVSPKDMKVDLIVSAEDKVTVEAVQATGLTLIPPGAILVVTRSGILQHSVPVAVTAVEVVINQDLKALIPAPGLDPEFLAEQLRTRTPELLAHARKSGTTVESLAFNRLKSFSIKLAPPREQAAIGAQVSALRSRAARLRKQLDVIPALMTDTLDQLANKMAIGQLSTAGVHSAKTQPVALGDLLEEPARTGISVRGSLDPPGIKALRLSAMRTPVVDLADVRYLPIGDDRAKPVALRRGDVLISRGSGSVRLVAKASLVPALSDLTIFPDTTYRVRLKRDLIRPDWFVAVWNAPFTRAQFDQRIRTTAGIWKVAWRDLKGVLINLPSLDEQADAVEALRALTARLNRVRAKREAALRTLARYEAAMVAKAFDGSLIEPIPDDENPSLLRARLLDAQSHVPSSASRKKLVTTPTTLDDLLRSWPSAGQTFEQVQEVLRVDYETARNLIFEALEKGIIVQQFDSSAKLMTLVKPS